MFNAMIVNPLTSNPSNHPDPNKLTVNSRNVLTVIYLVLREARIPLYFNHNEPCGVTKVLLPKCPLNNFKCIRVCC